MSPDGVAPAGEPPHDPWMEARVTRLEDDMGEIKATLRRLEPMIVRLDAVVPHLATKADLADLRTELAGVRTELKQDNAGLRTELKDEIGGLRTELKDEIGGLRTELKDQIANLRTELKDEIAGLRTELKDEIAEVKLALADKPSRAYMWTIMTAMVAAFACGLAGLAILK